SVEIYALPGSLLSGNQHQVVKAAVDPDRSYNMSRIRGKDTKPELKMRRALHALGLRFRLHRRDLPGTPDIVLPRWNAVIDIRGCFWHRHAGCRYATMPSSNVTFWKTKFTSNVTRDNRTSESLDKLGWRVAILWECSIRREGENRIAHRLLEWLANGTSHIEI
ncbi:very short patch repair endonuclease, partial [Sphingobium yanoikuyae]|uniref:very short patch repair endonuclease n=1 Tax=Sphingobium yanoikuyae TaxID=13690 RepID=UPI0028AB3ED3